MASALWLNFVKVQIASGSTVFATCRMTWPFWSTATYIQASRHTLTTHMNLLWYHHRVHQTRHFRKLSHQEVHHPSHCNITNRWGAECNRNSYMGILECVMFNNTWSQHGHSVSCMIMLFPFHANHQIRPQAKSKVGCKPGNCRWPLYLPHVFVRVYGSTLGMSRIDGYSYTKRFLPCNESESDFRIFKKKPVQLTL